MRSCMVSTLNNKSTITRSALGDPARLLFSSNILEDWDNAKLFFHFLTDPLCPKPLESRVSLMSPASSQT